MGNSLSINKHHLDIILDHQNKEIGEVKNACGLNKRHSETAVFFFKNCSPSVFIDNKTEVGHKLTFSKMVFLFSPRLIRLRKLYEIGGA